MILILSDTITTRLQYTADFIFKENFGVEYSITTDKKAFEDSNEIKINYSKGQYSKGVINISGSSLLFEKKIHEQTTETFEVNGLTAFFRNESSAENFPFDIFSATFYLLSRYEEYLPHIQDKYGRYDHRQSLASINGFLRIPMVNKWLAFFAHYIKTRFTNFQVKKREFHFLPTYDVDVAFEWKHKGFLRNAVQVFKLIMRQDYKKISDGFAAIQGKIKDPSDNFQFFEQLHEDFYFQPAYFFLVSKNITKYDKNISPLVKEMKALIKQLSEKNDIGIHPSYYSSQDEKLLKEEKFLLEEITGKTIKKSRQHYLRFNLPETYRQLINAGITHEFSMGYGTANGFRASYSGSFYWYDIQREERTALIVHPFCYMDSNTIFHQKLTAEKSFEELMYFFNTCKDAGGPFITVMHNHLPGDNDLKWRNVYEQFLLETIKQINV